MKRSQNIKPYIKYIALLLLFTLITGMFSGCALVPNDISELESPPKLTAEQQAISKALESKVQSKITLEYPLEGEYRSAYVLKKLDSKNQYALAFYSTNGITYIAVLRKENGNWRFIQPLSENGKINSVSFADFDGDGTQEFAVGWVSVTNPDLKMVVYSVADDNISKVNLGQYTKMITTDMDQDGKQNLLLFKLDSNKPKQSVAELFGYTNGKFEKMATAPLDGTVSEGYAGIYTTKIDGNIPAVLVDGYKSNHSMVTELFYYKNGSLFAPLYDNGKHTVTATMRYLNEKCRDIDGDSVVEIPVPVELNYVADKKDDNKSWLVRWSSYDTQNGLKSKLSCIMNDAGRYYFIYPEKWTTNGVNNVTYRQVSKNQWDFCEWDNNKSNYGNILFSIYNYSNSSWNVLADKTKLVKIDEENGTIYAVKLGSDISNNSLALSMDEIRRQFKTFP